MSIYTRMLCCYISNM